MLWDDGVDHLLSTLEDHKYSYTMAIPLGNRHLGYISPTSGMLEGWNNKKVEIRLCALTLIRLSYLWHFLHRKGEFDYYFLV